MILLESQQSLVFLLTSSECRIHPFCLISRTERQDKSRQKVGKKMAKSESFAVKVC